MYSILIGMTQQIDDILKAQAGIWRGSAVAQGRQRLQVLDTGYPALNALLHGGGWPQYASNEFYLPPSGGGFGEMRLLLPALARLAGDKPGGGQRSGAAGTVFWIAPPFIPFAPALLQEHIDIQRLMIVRSECLQDSLWAAEQALLSGCCAAVFTWTGNAVIAARELRRLQLAAQQNASWHVLFRDHQCLALPSPSSLRVRLQPDSMSRLTLDIIKQPGGWAGQQCTLSVGPHFEQWQRLPVELLPYYNDTPLPQITLSESPRPLTAVQPLHSNGSDTPPVHFIPLPR